MKKKLMWCVFSTFSFLLSMVSLLVAQSIQYKFVAILSLASGVPAHILAIYAFQYPVNEVKVSKK